MRGIGNYELRTRNGKRWTVVELRAGEKGVMTIISLQEAQAKLTDLIHHLTHGDELVITENDQPVARLVTEAVRPERAPRRPGALRTSVRGPWAARTMKSESMATITRPS